MGEDDQDLFPRDSSGRELIFPMVEKKEMGTDAGRRLRTHKNPPKEEGGVERKRKRETGKSRIINRDSDIKSRDRRVRGTIHIGKRCNIEGQDARKITQVHDAHQ